MENRKAIRNPIIRIVHAVFPYFENRAANKILLKKIEKIQSRLSYNDEDSVLKEFNSPEKIDVKVLEDRLEDNQHRMERLEDKAKIQVVGITIAISIIIGAAGKLQDIARVCAPLRWAIFVLLVISVIYMACSGLYAYYTLTDMNLFFYPPNNISEMEDKEKKEMLNAVIAKNQFQNMIRNNEISTSYAFMRNALILLIVVFIIWNVPI